MNPKQNQKSAQKNKNLIKGILILAMTIAFLIVAFTGILKFIQLLRPLEIDFSALPMKEISILHDWTGVFLIILITLHLIEQRYGFKKYLIGFDKQTLKKLFYFLIPVLILFSIYLVVQSRSAQVKRLKEVEIRDYEGEKLGSIDDFKENSIKGPQYIEVENYQLKVDGLVQEELNLTYDEVLSLDKYKKAVKLNCVEGWSVKILWEGVLLRDILKRAGSDPKANTIIFYAHDGYSSSLDLDYILDNDIMLAYKMNGLVLPKERGFPFQVVAQDKWGYKWVKWVNRIEVSDNRDFRGFWEKAGYNQRGDFSGPKFED